MMVHLIDEENRILDKIVKYDESSEEYQALQKKLIELHEQRFKGCPFVH